MVRRLGCWLFGALLLVGCTEKAESVRAAQPHLESFGHFRIRALDLLELRADIEQKKLLFAATHGDPDALPENLEPVLERMKAQNVEIGQSDLDEAEALFWRQLDRAFLADPEVLQAEIVLLGKDGAISLFRSPREREVPAGVRWYGLRAPRTFSGLANCLTEDGSEPCVLVQLRPRDYAGSAGLTVAFRRAP